MLASGVLLCVVLQGGVPSSAEPRQTVPSDSLLAGVSNRGRQLAAYDAVAWHGTDALLALSPKQATFDTYLAQQTPEGWTLSFGRLNSSRDTFSIAYQAVQVVAHTDSFAARALDPPRPSTAFEKDAAVAIA